jgi:3-deoxy-7-phosphoheptulonate synthase
MLVSFIEAGRQEPGDFAGLVYGQSITDSCMDIATTADVLHNLTTAVRLRRDLNPQSTASHLHLEGRRARDRASS